MLPIEIIKRLKRTSKSYGSRIHGIKHWRTVERNGLYLAQFTGADPIVVSCFAFFHDCMRENDGHDPKHGARGAKFAKKIRRFLPLDDEQFGKLTEACCGHTEVISSSCPTIGTCWDADRLDLGRVSITPDSKFLSTDEAKRIADEDDLEILYQLP